MKAYGAEYCKIPDELWGRELRRSKYLFAKSQNHSNIPKTRAECRFSCRSVTFYQWQLACVSCLPRCPVMINCDELTFNLVSTVVVTMIDCFMVTFDQLIRFWHPMNGGGEGGCGVWWWHLENLFEFFSNMMKVADHGWIYFFRLCKPSPETINWFVSHPRAEPAREAPRRLLCTVIREHPREQQL